MPPEGRNPTDPNEWMRRARSNLARARAGRTAPDVLLEDACFDAQQAAEKAVKAVLVAKRVPFPKTHDLAALMTLVERAAGRIPDHVLPAAALTRYATEARYPVFSTDVTEEEHARAVELAGGVVVWAATLLNEG
jgi:HEPN domain-containing protein